MLVSGLVLILLLCITWWMWSRSCGSFLRRIEKIPGPKGRFFFGNALEFYNLKSEDILNKVVSDFVYWGPTVRYWFRDVPVVLVSDVDDIRTILSGKFSQEKGILYDYLKPWLGTGLLTSKGNKWKFMRRIITPTFHFSILRRYVPVFTRNARIMLDLIGGSTSGEKCNLSRYLTYCALDSICETSMGKRLNSQRMKKESEYVTAIFRIGQIVVERLFSPFLYSDWIFALSSLGRENRKVLKILHGVTSKLIEERKGQDVTSFYGEEEGKDDENNDGRKQVPFLDLLIEKQKIYSFSDSDLREEVDTILMAGHDTTSTALNWCFFELGHNDVVQEKIHRELDDIFGDSDRDPDHEDLARMDYLKRVLQETLRLYPSAPVISRKFNVDVRLKNYLVPANTEIVLLLYHIHRNPEVFPQPEIFDPDRFLSEAFNKRNSFAYIPFSAGSRNCLGQKYAMLQMLVLSSSLLRRYKIKTLTERKLVRPVPDVILRPSVQLQWKLIPREKPTQGEPRTVNQRESINSANENLTTVEHKRES